MILIPSANAWSIDAVTFNVFFKVTEFLVENDEEQLTIPDLVGKRQQCLHGNGEPP